MIIDFNEQKFKNVVKDLLRPFDLSNSDIEEVISQALAAVRKASKPVK